MAIVDFDPIVKWFRGRIGGLVYRRAHNGKVSVYLSPDMSRVKSSKAQKDHRQDFREAVLYASAAVADPDLRLIYVQMAIVNGKTPVAHSIWPPRIIITTATTCSGKSTWATGRNPGTGRSTGIIFI